MAREGLVGEGEVGGIGYNLISTSIYVCVCVCVSECV